MISWNDFYAQEQRRKDRIAEAEKNRMYQVSKPEKDESLNKEPSLNLSGKARKAIQWLKSQRAQGSSEMGLAGER